MATRLMPFCQERDGCMSAVAATPAMDRTMPASSNMSWVIIMLASMAYTMAMRRRLRFSGAVRMRRAMAEVRPLPLPRHPTWGENSARIFGRYSGRKFTGELSSRHSLLQDNILSAAVLLHTQGNHTAVSPSLGSDYISTTTPPESLAKTSGSAPRPSGRTSTVWANSSTTTGSLSAWTTRTPRTAHSERGERGRAWRWWPLRWARPSWRRAAPAPPEREP